MGLTRHDGLSVYGSGLYWTNAKGGTETNDVPFFGMATGNARQGAIRCDGRVTNISANATSLSTSLSTVLGVIATNNQSGLVNVIAWGSGNCIDIVCRSMSGTASSGVIAWVAYGY